ncbi:hypothetical protein V1264_015944 [Littorina saxatilis]|uniref:Uncharacterized protein n=1 Tax=Littorina saxatilis TaxID=31220 RepID=A0AAN9GIL4_9CAEN
MVVSSTNQRDGVVFMDRSQVKTVPGPQPQRGPPNATGDSHPSDVAGDGRSRATGYQIKVMHWNAEGVRNKKIDLQNFLKQQNIDVCCMQETHLNSSHRFSIRGYETFRHDRASGHKGGVIILVKNSMAAAEIYRSQDGATECLGVCLLAGKKPLAIFNVYSPPAKQLDPHNIPILPDRCLITGDFNSHSPSWGYRQIDSKGEEVEDWMLTNQLTLLNQPDDPCTYYSRAWRTTSSPDLAIATDDVAQITTREVSSQLGGSDHKPVILNMNEERNTTTQKQTPRWNYKKAKWGMFQQLLDKNCRKLDFKDQNLNQHAELFCQAVLKAAKNSIPRGSRKNYKPGWNSHLQQLHDMLSSAREAMELNPTDENVTAHNRARAEFTREKLQQLRNSWHEKTQSLNMEKDTTKLWQLAHTLNDDVQERKQTVLELDGELQTGKKAANTLANMYQETSTVKLPRDRTKAVREAIRQPSEKGANSSCMYDPIRLDELEAAIKALKCKKAPGPDGISNDMLKHMGTIAKKTLLLLFNESWKSTTVPAMWKKAHIVPIHKKGKNKKDPKSYRPISLISCLSKLMERILNRRLIWHLETNSMLTPTQTGYRKNRSTEDQLALLAQEIETAFQEKKKVVSVFFDLSAAFDKVWREGLLLKIHQAGITGRMFGWIKSFLHERSAKVLLDGHESVSVKMREGVPQGGVISPTLFLVYINDITTSIPRLVSNTLHADDLAVWHASEHTTTAAYRLQQSVDSIKKWTDDWGLEINRVKTVSTVFSLSTSKEKVQLKLGDTVLPQVDTPTFLGVKLDRRLSWKPHIEDMESRGIKRLALMRKLSGTTWGANSKILKKVYTGTVRPVLEYASSSWNTAAKTNKTRLDKVQNLGLRTILGAMKTTPITEMEKTASVQPLEARREEKLLIQGEKMKRLESHPLHDKLQALTKNRLKRQSLNHQIKEQQRNNADILTPSPTQCEPLTSTDWTPQRLGAEIRTSIPGVTSKQNQSDAALRALALDEIHQRYPASKWTLAYTDGSAEDATRNGGSGAYILQPKKPPTTLSAPSGALSSNFKAEVNALSLAASFLNSVEETPKNTVFLTDSVSALESSNTDQSLEELKHQISTLARKSTVVLQWIPAHCGISGNEKADELAKNGSKMEQPNHCQSYREAKTLIKHRWKEKFTNKTSGYKPQKDPLHLLSRAEQAIIFRLRTGHCCLKAHLRRIGVAESATCDCGEGDQTPEHVLQACPLLDQLRIQTWPDPTDLRTKMWGALEDLERTSMFMASSRFRV